MGYKEISEQMPVFKTGQNIIDFLKENGVYI